MAAFKIIVLGRVQGVNFRRFAEISANRLGINGYVKNLGNGNVEVLAEGEKNKMELFIEELRKGPPYSHVDSLEIKEIEKQGYNNFEISY